MPVEKNRNLPLMGHVVKRLLEWIEYEWASPMTTDVRRRLLVMVGTYIAVTYGYSLRGNEGFWMDGNNLQDYIHLGKFDNPVPHVVISLLGFFKAETGEQIQQQRIRYQSSYLARKSCRYPYL